MLRRAMPLLLLLSASAALADTADLRVTIMFPVVVARASRPLPYTVHVLNAGPDTAENVTATALSNPVGSDCHHDFPSPIPRGQWMSFDCYMTAPSAETTLSVTASATASTPELNPADNTATNSIAVLTNPDLIIDVITPLNIEPGLPFTLTLRYLNSGGGDAEATRISAVLPAGVQVKKLPAACTASAQYVTCQLGTVPMTFNYDVFAVDIELLAPDDRNGSPLVFIADISNSRPEFETSNNRSDTTARLFQAYVVESTADAGPATLRQAITDANAACSSAPCEVQFRLDPGQHGWASIRPRSALPVVTAENLLIDGTTQTRFRGDTNSEGPEVEINGSEQQDGDGLVIESSCDSMIRGLTLNGFPGSAIRLHATKPCLPARWAVRAISDNYIGTDPTGTAAIPNLRGITIANEEPVAYSYTGPFRIEKNVISGNTRSALFIDSPDMAIAGNTIGLDAGRKGPLPNHASGIFVSRKATNTDIANNAIAFNHEFGIAIERGARLTEIHGNSIHANWQPGIDIGLDGATAATEDPAAPSDLSARYDPLTNTTIIEGTSTHAEGTLEPIIRLFANDAPDRSGFGQGQYYLGETRTLFLNGGHRFTFTWPGDLRDKFIAATATRYNYFSFLRIEDLQPDDSQQGVEKQTSEFSRTVEVH